MRPCSTSPRRHNGMMAQLRQAWLLPVILLLGMLIGCASSPPATARTGTSTATGAPTVAMTLVPHPSPATAGALVVTVLATDVTLKGKPDDRSPSVGASFTINGNVINTVISVSGDLRSE